VMWMEARLIDPKTLQWNYKSASPNVDVLGAAPGQLRWHLWT